MIQLDIGLIFVLSLSIVAFIMITAAVFNKEYSILVQRIQVFLSIVVIISGILLLINGEFTFT